MPKELAVRVWRNWTIRVFVVMFVLAFIVARIGCHRRAKPLRGPIADLSGQPVHDRSATPVPDLSLTSPLNIPGGGPAPADAYEVYSGLYQDQLPEPLLFSDESVTDIPQVNGSCLRPSTPEEQEMSDAFAAANRQSHHWETKFTIPAGYKLIPREEAGAAQRCLETHSQDGSCARFKGILHVRFLGVPGFDRTHMHALVSVMKMCGSFCGSGGIFEAEK